MEAFDLRQWTGFSLSGSETNLAPIVDEIVIDSRRISSCRSLFVALKGNLDGHQFVSHAALMNCRYALVRNDWQAPPSLPTTLQLLRVKNPLFAFQEIAQAYAKMLNVPIIAIGGSYGKTMVKDLLHLMMKSRYHVISSPESFNSQIGVPLSLLTIKKEHEFALIETGFSQKLEMDRLANIIGPSFAILTHIGKKHLPTMGSMNAIANECAALLKAPLEDQWVLLPEDPLILPHTAQIAAKMHFWNKPAKTLPHAYFLPSEESGKMIFRVDFPDGTHHIGHVTCGFYYFLDLINMTTKAAWLSGVPSAGICEALHRYSPEPMRTEVWKTSSGVTFINDTYCSDPQSIDLGFRHFRLAPPHSRKFFIFQGIRCDEELQASFLKIIAKTIRSAGLKNLILIGDMNFSPLQEDLKDSQNLQIDLFSNNDDACCYLNLVLKPGDVVLVKGKDKQDLRSLMEKFDDHVTNNQCFINLSAIESNLQVIKSRLPLNTRVMVMIKALAYGTDDLRMASFLSFSGIDILGVSYVNEGIALRKAGITTEIFVLNAATFEAKEIVKWNFQVGVSEEGLIEALSQEAKKMHKCVKVHLHIDTGMNRFGCRKEKALELAKSIMNCSTLDLEGAMTHLACAENPEDDAFTLDQINQFHKTLEELKAADVSFKWIHALNSSGSLRFPLLGCNMIRVGLAVYGLYASSAVQKCQELRLAFSLQSRIVGINVCKKGETISYGRSYKVEKEEQKIAVLPIGYFDGLHRNYSGKGHVIIRGHKAPMVGRITMDYMMVDVTEIPSATIGDPVLLFGEDEFGNYAPPEDFAFKVDSIPHELITCLGPRIQRIFIYEETKALI